MNNNVINNEIIRESLMQKVFNDAPIGVLHFNKDFRVEYVNSAFLNITSFYGIYLDELNGKSLLDPDFYFVEIKEDIEQLKDGYSFEKEIKIVKGSANNYISVIVKASPIVIDNSFAGGTIIIEDLKIIDDLKNDYSLKSEYVFKTLNNTNDAVIITDNLGKIIRASGKGLQKTGFKAEELLNHSIDIILRKDKSVDFETVYAAISGMNYFVSEAYQFEFRENNKHFICKTEPIFNKLNVIQLIFFVINDVTDSEKKIIQLEERVKEFEFYSKLIDTLNDSVVMVKADGEIISWNKNSEYLFGLYSKQVLGKNIAKFIEYFSGNILESIKEELTKNKSYELVFNYKDSLGERILQTKIYANKNPEDIYIFFFYDVTEKTIYERELRKNEEKFRNIVIHTEQNIFNVDPNGRIVYMNPAVVDTLGYSEKELLNLNFYELIEPRYLKEHVGNIELLFRSKDGVDIPLITKRGYVLYFYAKFYPVQNERRALLYHNIIMADITQKKAAEKDLLIFRSLFEASEEGIAVSLEGKIILANDSFFDMFGYNSIEEIYNKNLIDLADKNEREKIRKYFIDEDYQKSFEFLALKKDETNFYSSASLAEFKVDNKNYLVLIARDITERRRAQQALRESEEKYRNITENIDDFLFTYEKDGNIFKPLFYSTSVEKITGFTHFEFLADSRLLLKLIHPDDFAVAKKKIKNILKSKIQLSDEIELRIINKMGNIVWVRSKVNLYREGTGVLNKIYGLVSDITLRKKAEEELKKTTDNLVKLNDTKDKFISIISHDLRTPFSSIMGFTDLLLSDDDLSEVERKQYVQYIQESSRTMLSLVNSLLDWTRLQTGRIKFEPEKTYVYEIVEQSINAMSGAALQKNITLMSLVERDINLFVDRNLISQVFNNLISNAIKFTRAGGEIIINARQSAQSRYFEVSVRDNGIGIKPENIHNLFRVDAKYTSEGTSGEKGSGLGLSLVKEIIDKHGGTIWVNSHYNVGTEFVFTLPIASPNILLVDDSKTDRLLYSKIVKNISPDYNIETAENGKDALEIINTRPPALIITDHMMPLMTGYQLINEIKKAGLKHTPPFIVLSADIDKFLAAEYMDLGVEYVFQKPVSLSNFKLAVEKTIRKGML